jgi:transposase-like protein
MVHRSTINSIHSNQVLKQVITLNSLRNGSTKARHDGYNKKSVSTQYGETEIKVPRDRNSEFEPQVLEKYQTKSNDIEKQIFAMYSKGMSTRDIEDHLRDIYGIDASASLLSRITDKIMPQIAEWQARPLESIYPVVFLDGIVFKVRKESKVINRCAYTVLGIRMDGKKEIFGLWLSDNESATFWLSVCNELKNRGVKDLLIAFRDNLTGFSTAISTVFPETEQQLFIIHQIKNSTKYVSYKDLKPIMSDLKLIYKLAAPDEAEYQLLAFEEKWSKKYPQIAKS